MYAMAGCFSHGCLTPLGAFLAACAGGALGLRCLVRSLRSARPWRACWLALSSAALGCGIWITHTIAMMGFTVAGTRIGYDPLILFASLGVAIVMIGAGVFIVGYRGVAGPTLFTGGTVAGLGIASLHYLSMAGVRVSGRLEYNTITVTASVVIAVVAATGALWAAGRRGGARWRVGASLAVGVAGVGMHYVGMAAVRVRLSDGAVTARGDAPVTDLALMLTGPALFLLLLSVVVLIEPRLTAAVRRRRPPQTAPARRLAVLPNQRSGRVEERRTGQRAGQKR